jgi:hypothetical protein
MLSFSMSMRGTGGADFENPMDPGGGTLSLGSGLNLSFAYALVSGEKSGLSFEPALETFLVYGSRSHFPHPWRNTRHAALSGTLHGGVRIAKDVVLGASAKVTPFVNATTPYDDIMEMRGTLRIDSRYVIVRAEFARSQVRGSDAMLGSLDGDASEVGGSVMFKVMGR